MLNKKTKGIIIIILLVLVFVFSVEGSCKFFLATLRVQEGSIYRHSFIWREEITGSSILGHNFPTFQVFPITTDPGNQFDPAIYENTVVWADYRNDESDICGYDLLAGEEFQITADKNIQWYPAIYRNIVVWYDKRNGNDDIYGYNLSTSQEFPITTNSHDQYNAVIYRDIVVWADKRNGNWDIYGYNLSTEEEFQITTDLDDQYDPAIYGDIVTWTDTRNGNKDIYEYSFSTNQEFPVTTNLHVQGDSAIYEDIIVWKDERNGNWDIYGYYRSTREEFQITTDTSNQGRPAIYGGIVVWEDDRNGNKDIYGLNLSTREEFQITTDLADQYEPAIHEKTIVWMDEQNDNKDIYGYCFSIQPPRLISPENHEKDVQLKITFSWDSVSNVENYTIQISTNQSFTSFISERTDSTSFTLDSKLKEGKKYYWRVRAENKFGSSDWSDTWNFKTECSLVFIAAIAGCITLILGIIMIIFHNYHMTEEPRPKVENTRQIKERIKGATVLRLNYRFTSPQTKVYLEYRETSGKAVHVDIRQNIGTGGFVTSIAQSDKPFDEIEAELEPGDYTIWFSCGSTEKREVSYKINIIDMNEHRILLPLGLVLVGTGLTCLFAALMMIA